ncbi:MAG: nuclear transport factor 2 family protein [Actinobacteria bacterium]|nr:nuclear transport factor 2 family protein [Actinomycetota bacterium]
MAASDVEAVRELYEAFNAGNLDRVRELFSDDIVWEEPKGYFVTEAAGTTRGIDEVLAIFESTRGSGTASRRRRKSSTTPATGSSSWSEPSAPAPTAAPRSPARSSTSGTSRTGS